MQQKWSSHGHYYRESIKLKSKTKSRSVLNVKCVATLESKLETCMNLIVLIDYLFCCILKGIYQLLRAKHENPRL